MSSLCMFKFVLIYYCIIISSLRPSFVLLSDYRCIYWIFHRHLNMAKNKLLFYYPVCTYLPVSLISINRFISFPTVHPVPIQLTPFCFILCVLYPFSSVLFPLLHFDIHPVVKCHLILSLNRATALFDCQCLTLDSQQMLLLFTQLCLTLCDTMDCSTQAALSFTSGACSNSRPLSQWCHPTVSSSDTPFSSEPAPRIRWPKYCNFSFSISPSSEYSGLLSIRIDWFDLLAVQGTLKSLHFDIWQI